MDRIEDINKALDAVRASLNFSLLIHQRYTADGYPSLTHNPSQTMVKESITAEDCSNGAEAFEVLSALLSGRKRAHPRPPGHTCPSVDSLRSVLVGCRMDGDAREEALRLVERLREENVRLRAYGASAERLARAANKEKHG